METKIKKLLPLAGIVCSVFATGLFADHDSMHQQHQTQQKEMYPAGIIHEGGQYREITPSAGPRVSDGVDLFITADFIYWKARQDGLGYVANGYSSTTANASSGSVQQVGFEFDPGFKVGLGLNLCHDGWDVYAQYTWLHSNPGKSSKSDPTGTTLFPMWNIANEYPTHDDGIINATGNWDLQFNVIDLELGRNYFISQYLTLRPHFGFKGTWQDNDYSVVYITVDGPNIDTNKMNNDQDYWGFGIRTGLQTAWHFNTNWSIFGDFAISALWGKFDTTRKDVTSNDSNPATIQTVFNVENNFYTLKEVLELALGLRWETWFSDDDYHFMIQAGWEEQIWLSNNQLISFYEESAHGDLTLHGLTIKARFDF